MKILQSHPIPGLCLRRRRLSFHHTLALQAVHFRGTLRLHVTIKSNVPSSNRGLKQDNSKSYR